MNSHVIFNYTVRNIIFNCKRSFFTGERIIRASPIFRTRLFHGWQSISTFVWPNAPMNLSTATTRWRKGRNAKKRERERERVGGDRNQASAPIPADNFQSILHEISRSCLSTVQVCARNETISAHECVAAEICIYIHSCDEFFFQINFSFLIKTYDRKGLIIW